jgi:hypothetical protein
LVDDMTPDELPADMDACTPAPEGEAVAALRALVRDCLANDFNELWDSYTAAQAVLAASPVVPAPEREACWPHSYETDAAGQVIRCVDCGMSIASEASHVVPAPEGEAWRTVPVEPTEAMIEAAHALWGEGTGVNYVQLEPEDFYAAMLAASPVVPVGVSREEIAKALFERHWSAVSASPKWPGDDDGSYWLWLTDAILAALRPTDTGRER